MTTNSLHSLYTESNSAEAKSAESKSEDFVFINSVPFHKIILFSNVEYFRSMSKYKKEENYTFDYTQDSILLFKQWLYGVPFSVGEKECLVSFPKVIFNLISFFDFLTLNVPDSIFSFIRKRIWFLNTDEGWNLITNIPNLYQLDSLPTIKKENFNNCFSSFLEKDLPQFSLVENDNLLRWKLLVFFSVILRGFPCNDEKKEEESLERQLLLSKIYSYCKPIIEGYLSEKESDKKSELDTFKNSDFLDIYITVSFHYKESNERKDDPFKKRWYGLPNSFFEAKKRYFLNWQENKNKYSLFNYIEFLKIERDGQCCVCSCGSGNHNESEEESEEEDGYIPKRHRSDYICSTNEILNFCDLNWKKNRHFKSRLEYINILNEINIDGSISDIYFFYLKVEKATSKLKKLLEESWSEDVFLEYIECKIHSPKSEDKSEISKEETDMLMISYNNGNQRARVTLKCLTRSKGNF